MRRERLFGPKSGRQTFFEAFLLLDPPKGDRHSGREKERERINQDMNNE